MKYAIVKTALATAHGMAAKFHQTSPDGQKMAVNENELLKINSDITEAATQLGGKVMELDEAVRELNNVKQ